MLMRKIPLRGEKYRLLTEDIVVTALEKGGENHIKVIMENGKIMAVPEESLDLPIIDTKQYKKLRDSA